MQHLAAADRATRTICMCNGFGLHFARNDLWIEAQDIVTLAMADEEKRRTAGERVENRGAAARLTHKL